jgi:hypothetical protein
VEGGIPFQEFFAFLSKTKKAYHYVEYIEQQGWFNGGGEPIHSAIIEDREPIHELRYNALVTKQEARSEDVLTNPIALIHQAIHGDSESTLSIHMFFGEYSERSFYK